MKYREPRRPTDVAANIHFDEGACTGVVRSISASGVKIEAMSPPPVECVVSVEMLGKTRAATVVWCRDKYVGLMFDAPLSGIELASIYRPSSIPHKNIGPTVKKPQGHGFKELR